MKNYYLLILVTAAILNRPIKANNNLENLKLSAINYRLKLAIDAYNKSGMSDAKKILQEGSVDTDSIPKISLLFSGKLVNRWNSIQKALAENDIKTVKKKLTDHALSLLEIAIEDSNYNDVEVMLTTIEKLGTLTEKQKNRLATTVSQATVADQLRKQLPINWAKYGFGTVFAITAGTAYFLLRMKQWKAETFTVFSVSCALAPIYGYATYLIHSAEKNQQIDAPRIKEVLHKKLQ